MSSLLHAWIWPSWIYALMCSDGFARWYPVFVGSFHKFLEIPRPLAMATICNS